MKTRKLLISALASGTLLSGAPALCGQTAPVITQPPTNETVLLGAWTSFSVTAASSTPPSYVWEFNGRDFSNLVTTVAGGGTNFGNGGQATNAILSNPYGVAAY